MYYHGHPKFRYYPDIDQKPKIIEIIESNESCEIP